MVMVMVMVMGEEQVLSLLFAMDRDILGTYFIASSPESTYQKLA